MLDKTKRFNVFWVFINGTFKSFLLLVISKPLPQNHKLHELFPLGLYQPASLVSDSCVICLSTTLSSSRRLDINYSLRQGLVITPRPLLSTLRFVRPLTRLGGCFFWHHICFWNITIIPDVALRVWCYVSQFVWGYRLESVIFQVWIWYLLLECLIACDVQIFRLGTISIKQSGQHRLMGQHSIN